MPMETKDWATLAVAIYGAGAATLSLAINWFNRRDAIKQRAEKHRPWVDLTVFAGNAWCRSVSACFINPSEIDIMIETIEIMTPIDWVVVSFKPEGLFVPTQPDLKNAGRHIKGQWKLRSSAEGPEPAKTLINFIIAKSGWPGEIGGIGWQYAKDLPLIEAEVRFHGHYVKADREPVIVGARLA